MTTENAERTETPARRTRRRFSPGALGVLGGDRVLLTCGWLCLVGVAGAADPPRDYVEPTRAALLAAARAGGDWLVAVQRKSGGLVYAYDPRTDRYDERTVNTPRLAGSAWCLGQLYAATGEVKYGDAAERALHYLRLRRTREAAEDRGWSYVFDPGQSLLGASALALLAETEWEAAVRAHDPAGAAGRIGRSGLADWAARLAGYLVFLQQPSGKFAPVYRADEDRVVADQTWLFCAEEATLALVRYHRATGGEEWLAAAERGARYLIDEVPQLRPARKARTDAWLIQACRDLHALTQKKAYLDYAIAAAEDWLAIQYTSFNARDPADVGGFDDGVPVPLGPVAAARCEGFVAAWRLTVEIGAPRADLYRAICLCVGFQLRHQFTAATAASFARPERVVGGVAFSRTDPTLRIDYVQHHVSALLGLLPALDR